VAIRIVKIGGAALADETWLERFAAFAQRSEEPFIIVHGGGPEISARSERLGVAPLWKDGRRITSQEALNVATMVLSGSVNKRIVSTLVTAGVQAIGVSGEDAALLLAVPRDGGALGLVGEVVAVRGDVLHGLLGLGLIPVVSPISRGMDGKALNVNADDAAMAVAAKLDAFELLFLTDVQGVMDETGITAASLTAESAAELVRSGVAHGGMAVKLEAALAALRAGVSCVRIGGLEMLVDANAGTALRGAARQQRSKMEEVSK
jgi:acetylglutamate kinase